MEFKTLREILSALPPDVRLFGMGQQSGKVRKVKTARQILADPGDESLDEGEWSIKRFEDEHGRCTALKRGYALVYVDGDEWVRANGWKFEEYFAFNAKTGIWFEPEVSRNRSCCHLHSAMYNEDGSVMTAAQEAAYFRELYRPEFEAGYCVESAEAIWPDPKPA